MAQARQAAANTSLDQQYNSLFEVVPAVTPELLDEVYKNRYRVYCVERPFEDPGENPGGRETDEYDERSVHSLLVYRQTRDVAGTVRLILPLTGSISPEFPIQKVCPQVSPWPENVMPATTTAEISRFTISKNFRRRIGDTLYTDTVDQADKGSRKAGNRRSSPQITIGLLRAIVKMSEANGITHWCALMEPTLLRLLSRIGVYFIPVGPLVEYHGWRQPCYGNFSEIYAALRERRPDIWDAIAS